MSYQVDRFLGIVGKVVSSKANDDTDQQTQDAGCPDSPGEPQNGSSCCGQNGIDACCYLSAGVKSTGWVAVFTDPGGHDTQNGSQQT